MLTFAARPKLSAFGSHSPNIDNSSFVMGQGGGGTSRLKRLSWMLHPSRPAHSLASDGSTSSPRPPPRRSVKGPIKETTSSKALKDVELVSSSAPQVNPVKPQSTTPKATPDTHKSEIIPDSDISAHADADTSASLDPVPDTKPRRPTTVHISTDTSVATSASASNSSSTASEDASPTEARKSSISFPVDLPKPEHSPSIQTPIDGLSESSFGRKSSVSSVSFRRSGNTSVGPSLRKQVSNGLPIRAASPPPQR
ncbi:hypothetical protein E4U42_007476 [Claviceps africana]|uniref:Uncharacterized protein n=1 Tax=Claviceps africana TaxID=83212 RepID=A0A8K0J2Y4_9HYPO|nr:hypothetical protein E4U42_007476 [Claviceps africana]